MKKEITVLSNEEFNDDFTCGCGNTVSSSGFYPCNENGEEVEPNKDSDWNGLYVCGGCGKIYKHLEK